MIKSRRIATAAIVQKMRKSIIFVLFVFLTAAAKAQTADDAFRRPLKEVISDIEKQFNVKIRYSEDLVRDRWVTYAGWRFRPDVEQTLTNVTASQDITFAKEGEGKYKLQSFQYHLKTPQEGKQQLDYLWTRFHDVPSWEKRKEELRECMWKALRLSPLPARPKSAPIISNKRTMNGYTIENVAIETLPGLYVCGSLYRPLSAKGKVPVILNPDGHFGDGRYRSDAQYRCAMEARMGAIAFSYDLFAWGESALQFPSSDHRKSLAMSIQALNSIRILDWLLTFKNADPSRVAITGGSGGGSQTMLITALDDRIKLSVPVVMMSSYHSGGCPCESGMGVHLCGGGSNNVEIAAMAAPRPQLVVSDGKDWTQQVPQVEFPYLKKIYSFYGKDALVENAHLPKEGHDYGKSKRMAMYNFIARHFRLDLKKVSDANGNIDESAVTIEKYPAMYVFGEKGETLPANAIHNFSEVEKFFR